VRLEFDHAHQCQDPYPKGRTKRYAGEDSAQGPVLAGLIYKLRSIVKLGWIVDPDGLSAVFQNERARSRYGKTRCLTA